MLFRSLISHGIWFREPVNGEFLVRRLRGSWPKDKSGYKKSKRVLPQGERIDEADLASMLALTETAIAWVEELHAEIKNTLASSRKPQ